MLGYHVQIDDIEKKFKGIDPRTIRIGAARGINKLTKQLRTAAIKRIRAQYTLKARDVRKTMWMVRAKPARLIATLFTAGSSLALVKYKAEQVPTGVRTTIKKRSGPKIIPGGFKAAMPTMHVGFFKREPGAKHKLIHGQYSALPIVELRGPGMPQLMGSRESFRSLDKFVARKLDRVVGHEIHFEIDRAMKRRR